MATISIPSDITINSDLPEDGIIDSLRRANSRSSSYPMPKISKHAIDLWAQKKEYFGKWVLAMNDQVLICADTSDIIQRFVSKRGINPRDTLLIKF